MPRKPIDYSKTIIYKLVCNDLAVTDIYVGYTTDFTNRKKQHKRSCNNTNVESYNYKVYQIIRLNGGWFNWSMIQIEEYCCKDGNEARSRERYWFETLNANLNTCVPNRSRQEYKNINREKINENQRQYNENNKEHIKEYKSKPYTCECGNVFRQNEKSRHFKSKKHQNYLANLKEVVV
jgi:hypothetical protein